MRRPKSGPSASSGRARPGRASDGGRPSGPRSPSSSAGAPGSSRGGAPRGGPGKPTSGKPTSGKPTSGKPTSGKSASGKPTSGKSRDSAASKSPFAKGTPSRGRPSRGPARAPGGRLDGPSHARGEHTSPRIPIERGAPLPGRWLWTTRHRFEVDLVEELVLALGRDKAKQIAPGWVESVGAPTFADGELDVTFGRQGFVREEEATPSTFEDRVVALIGKLPAETLFTLSFFAADDDVGNPWMPELEAAEARVLARLTEAQRARFVALARTDRATGVALFAARVDEARIVLGRAPFEQLLSRHPGGRARMKVDADRPSRAARKVEEALHWLGVSPGVGDLCVDLGAAPGGWSWALLDRRARVIAVDPAELAPEIARHRGMKHEKTSAFTYVPEEPIDWLFCDMAWRPHEAAQLLAKWGRRRWTRFLVANLKLPMKSKAKTIEELRAIVHGGGFQRIRTRQLYHDREEITLIAVLR